MSVAFQEKREKPVTRLYDYEPSRKAYSRAVTAGTKDDPFPEIDEDTFIVGEAQEPEWLRPKAPMAGAKFVRGELLKRYRRLKPPNRLHGPSRKPKSRSAKKKASPTKKPLSDAVLQTYRGYVDAVYQGLAHLILDTCDGQRLEIQWDAADLSKRSIGERQPFVLKTLSIGNKLQYEFIPDRFRTLPKDLQREVADLLTHYRATGDLDDGDD